MGVSPSTEDARYPQRYPQTCAAVNEPPRTLANYTKKKIRDVPRHYEPQRTITDKRGRPPMRLPFEYKHTRITGIFFRS